MDTLRTWLKQFEAELEDYTKKHKVTFDSLTQYNPSEKLTTAHQNAACLFIGIAIGSVVPRLILRPYARYATVDDIPTSWIQQKAKINARAVKVTDGDTFRAVHWPPLRRPASLLDGKKKLSESTLQIRLAGIDTPETAKFGNVGQPFGEEAKETLTRLLSDSKLTLQLLSKDQYGRAVCSVWTARRWYWPFFRTNISEEMVKRGLATVYRQAGAVYGENHDVQLSKLTTFEEAAKASRLKIWKKKQQNTPAQYKASLKNS